MLLHIIRPLLPYIPIIDASVALDEPLIRPCVDVSDAAFLARMANHLKVHLKAANDALFGVY